MKTNRAPIFEDVEKADGASDGSHASLLERLRSAASLYVERLYANRSGVREPHDVGAIAWVARRRAEILAAEAELLRALDDGARALALGFIIESERDLIRGLIASARSCFDARSREREFAAAFRNFRASLEDFESEVFNRLCRERELLQLARNGGG